MSADINAMAHIQNKLFSALGRLPQGADVTHKMCMHLVSLPHEERAQFVKTTWGERALQGVQPLLSQLIISTNSPSSL